MLHIGWLKTAIILGEILRYPKRRFFEDVWNSKDAADVWRKWNNPVVEWMKKTLYKPLLDQGYSNNTCAFICFFASGLFHEITVSMLIGAS